MGADKTHTQHVGNAAFGLASLFGTLGNVRALANVAGASPAGRLLPGLNLVAAGVEGYNAVRKHRAGEHVVAMTAAGNSLGCLSSFLGESSLLALRSGGSALPAALAAGGGVLGLVAGTIELRQGLANRKLTGSSRTLAMGVLDLTSGVVSLAGSALLARHRGLGMTMLIGSGLVDLAGIGVDYLWPSRKRPGSDN
ncbi:MAG: hypothetical protein U0931_09560 [Vulcanimicrobiota bacterium]